MLNNNFCVIIKTEARDDSQAVPRREKVVKNWMKKHGMFVVAALLAILILAVPTFTRAQDYRHGQHLHGPPLFRPNGDASRSIGGRSGIPITAGYQWQNGEPHGRRYYHPQPGPWRNQWHPGATPRQHHYRRSAPHGYRHGYGGGRVQCPPPGEPAYFGVQSDGRTCYVNRWVIQNGRLICP